MSVSTGAHQQSSRERFHWNVGGWFGSSIGSTLWMLLAAAVLGFHGQVGLAIVPTLSFMVVNGLAVVMWKQRHRIRAFHGLLMLMLALAVAIPITWFTVSSFATEDSLRRMNWPDSTAIDIGVCLIAPAMMAWFVFLNRGSVAQFEQSGSDVDHSANG